MLRKAVVFFLACTLLASCDGLLEDPDTTRLMISNEVRITGPGFVDTTPIEVFIDGRRKGVISYGSSKSYDVDKGKHELDCNFVGDGFLGGNSATLELASAEVEVVVEFDRMYIKR